MAGRPKASSNTGWSTSHSVFLTTRTVIESIFSNFCHILRKFILITKDFEIYKEDCLLLGYIKNGKSLEAEIEEDEVFLVAAYDN